MSPAAPAMPEAKRRRVIAPAGPSVELAQPGRRLDDAGEAHPLGGQGEAGEHGQGREPARRPVPRAAPCRAARRRRSPRCRRASRCRRGRAAAPRGPHRPRRPLRRPASPAARSGTARAPSPSGPARVAGRAGSPGWPRRRRPPRPRACRGRRVVAAPVGERRRAEPGDADADDLDQPRRHPAAAAAPRWPRSPCWRRRRRGRRARRRPRARAPRRPPRARRRRPEGRTGDVGGALEEGDGVAGVVGALPALRGDGCRQPRCAEYAAARRATPARTVRTRLTTPAGAARRGRRPRRRGRTGRPRRRPAATRPCTTLACPRGHPALSTVETPSVAVASLRTSSTTDPVAGGRRLARDERPGGPVVERDGEVDPALGGRAAASRSPWVTAPRRRRRGRRARSPRCRSR